MKQTYHEAMQKVFADEGGYTYDKADPGGPTNWGITIHDARMYWKPNATATDVRNMPKSVAEDIYAKHYAKPLHYDDLPPGVDYAILDYGINSGISRSAKVLQRLVGVPVDGVIGPVTLAAVKKKDPEKLINDIYDERLRFLKSLRTWSVFGKGWGRRVKEGRALALKLYGKYKNVKDASGLGTAVAGSTAVATSVGAATAVHHFGTDYLWFIVAGVAVVIAGIGVYIWRRYAKQV